MKSTKIIIITLIVVVSSSISTQVIAGWFGGDKLFPELAVKAGIEEFAFEITSDTDLQDWGKVTDIVDIKILKEYRTNQESLKELNQKFYQKGIEPGKFLTHLSKKIGLYNMDDKFKEELLIIVTTANFVVDGEKHKMIALLIFTKYPNKTKITRVSTMLANWSSKNPKDLDDAIRDWPDEVRRYKEAVKFFQKVYINKELMETF